MPKLTFSIGRLNEDVYIEISNGFEDTGNLSIIHKLKRVLYELK